MILVTVIGPIDGFPEEQDADSWKVSPEGLLTLYKGIKSLDGYTNDRKVIEYAPGTWRSVCPAPEGKR